MGKGLGKAVEMSGHYSSPDPRLSSLRPKAARIQSFYVFCYSFEMPDQKLFYVYILASKRNGTLYTGVTSDLARRVYEHQNDLIDGFTKKYRVHTLVYYEVCGDPSTAITRKKTIKHWPRQKKLQTIEQRNPDWIDLVHELV